MLEKVQNYKGNVFVTFLDTQDRNIIVNGNLFVEQDVIMSKDAFLEVNKYLHINGGISCGILIVHGESLEVNGKFDVDRFLFKPTEKEVNQLLGYNSTTII